MNYLTSMIKKADEIVGTIYSTIFNNSFAFAGVNYPFLNDKPQIDIGNRGNSWLEYTCFSHDGKGEGKTRLKGNSNKHHPAKTVAGIDISKVPKGAKKQYLMDSGLSEKEATKLMKRHR
jgi:hypothetical protein